MRYTLLLLLLINSFLITAQDLPTTVILVRHAEKAFDEGGDPNLTEEGQERAKELARMLESQSVDQIYSTPFKRTMQTVKPLADSKKLEIVEYNPFKLEETIELIKNATGGQTLVFSGHSNTVPVMVNKLLGKESFPMIDESVYDNLFIISFTEFGKGKVTHLKFGSSSSKGE